MSQVTVLTPGKNYSLPAPAVIMNNPKFARNVAGCMRACSAFGIETLVYSGDRFSLDSSKGNRLPREERMKGYRNVQVCQYDRPFDLFPDAVPIAIEVNKTAVQMQDFIHPENAVYVFGPEDGSIDSTWMRFCHQTVFIPTAHCLNLATAVTTTLAHRTMQMITNGDIPRRATDEWLRENRGWEDPPEDFGDGVDGGMIG